MERVTHNAMLGSLMFGAGEIKSLNSLQDMALETACFMVLARDTHTFTAY